MTLEVNMREAKVLKGLVQMAVNEATEALLYDKDMNEKTAKDFLATGSRLFHRLEKMIYEEERET